MALNKELREKMEKAEREYMRLGVAIANPDLMARPDELRRLARAMGILEPLANASGSIRAMEGERESLSLELSGDDAELAQMARDEIAGILAREEALHARLAGLVAESERDPRDGLGVVLEIRAGTGGEEAALFAADLLRMYLRYAERRGWTCEMAERSPTELGGIRDTVVLLEGRDAWGRMKREGGVHRVQRVPTTEAQGRIHTSAVSVAVLPQAEEVDIEIRPEDIRVDTFCSSGAGGQSVNTTYSAVRLVHVPTGITVQCQDERSQAKNKARAMKVLRARILSAREEALAITRGAARREQVKSGDRSDKMRTWNYPQNRVTDHKMGVTVHRLKDVLEGDLDLLLDAEKPFDSSTGPVVV
jgi:peptide chain release factor 1